MNVNPGFGVVLELIYVTPSSDPLQSLLAAKSTIRTRGRPKGTGSGGGLRPDALLTCWEEPSRSCLTRPRESAQGSGEQKARGGGGQGLAALSWVSRRADSPPGLSSPGRGGGAAY